MFMVDPPDRDYITDARRAVATRGEFRQRPGENHEGAVARAVQPAAPMEWLSFCHLYSGWSRRGASPASKRLRLASPTNQQPTPSARRRDRAAALQELPPRSLGSPRPGASPSATPADLHARQGVRRRGATGQPGGRRCPDGRGGRRSAQVVGSASWRPRSTPPARCAWCAGRIATTACSGARRPRARRRAHRRAGGACGAGPRLQPSARRVRRQLRRRRAAGAAARGVPRFRSTGRRCCYQRPRRGTAIIDAWFDVEGDPPEGRRGVRRHRADEGVRRARGGALRGAPRWSGGRCYKTLAWRYSGGRRPSASASTPSSRRAQAEPSSRSAAPRATGSSIDPRRPSSLRRRGLVPARLVGPAFAVRPAAPTRLGHAPRRSTSAAQPRAGRPCR